MKFKKKKRLVVLI